MLTFSTYSCYFNALGIYSFFYPTITLQNEHVNRNHKFSETTLTSNQYNDFFPYVCPSLKTRIHIKGSNYMLESTRNDGWNVTKTMCMIKLIPKIPFTTASLHYQSSDMAGTHIITVINHIIQYNILFYKMFTTSPNINEWEIRQIIALEKILIVYIDFVILFLVVIFL